MKKILFISPHTDDVELGCAGTIARFLEEGKEVFVLALSFCKNVYGSDKLLYEFANSMKVLSVKKWTAGGHPTRDFWKDRQEILDHLLHIRDLFQPDAVFVPRSKDIHQDHEMTTKAAMRIFKHQSIFGYELSQNSLDGREVNMFIRLEERHINKKLSSLQCYKSQIELKRPYFSPHFVRGLAYHRGVQISVEFAEAFEVIRSVL